MNEDNLKKLLNEALDPIKADLDDLKHQLSGVKEQLSDPETGLLRINEKLDANTASVVTIEQEIKTYGDMYKINNSNGKKLENRIEVLEDNAGIVPPPEFTLLGVS